jgi:signal peptidase I
MLKRLLFLFAIAGVGALFVRTFVAEGVYVASASMAPTLPQGEHLFLEKVTYRLRPPRRGEVVVFPSPLQDGKDLIKRVIALPGETVEIRNKTVSVNGAVLSEKYAVFTRPDEILQGDNLGPLLVPAGAVFVLGDNRDESGDSRDWLDPVTGQHMYYVPIKSIKGKIITFL